MPGPGPRWLRWTTLDVALPRLRAVRLALAALDLATTSPPYLRDLLRCLFVDDVAMRQAVQAARVARLATVAADGRPHLVPVCFALVGEVGYTAVDDKPKRSQRLRRIANVTATGQACLLVDQYDEDWSALWWVRLDCHARLVDSEPETRRGVAALVDKYVQYQRNPPAGPVIALDVYRWRGWAAK